MRYASFTMTFPYDDDETGRSVAEDVLDTLAEFSMAAGQDLGFDAHVATDMSADPPSEDE